MAGRSRRRRGYKTLHGRADQQNSDVLTGQMKKLKYSNKCREIKERLSDLSNKRFLTGIPAHGWNAC